jgi:hypothetical protein
MIDPQSIVEMEGTYIANNSANEPEVLAHEFPGFSFVGT